MADSAWCYIPTSLLEEQAAKLSGKDPAKGVFSIMHSYFETLGKYLLFTTYLLYIVQNMPTAQQKNRA